MGSGQEPRLIVPRRMILTVITISATVAALAIILGLYTEPQSFARKLCELFLQGAVLTVIGGIIAALVKQAFDEAADRRDEERKRHEKRLETLARGAEDRRQFLRRMADVHSAIEYASTLMRAHDSIETYLGQARELILLTSKLWEIHQDLTIAVGTFRPRDEEILENIEMIIKFLDRGVVDYQQVY